MDSKVTTLQCNARGKELVMVKEWTLDAGDILQMEGIAIPVVAAAFAIGLP
jgi:hypothetical protein